MKLFMLLMVLTVVGCSSSQTTRDVAQVDIHGGEVGNMEFVSDGDCALTTGVQGNKQVRLLQQGIAADSPIGKISILSNSRLMIEGKDQISYLQGGKSILVAEFINFDTFIYCGKNPGSGKSCVLTLGKPGNQTQTKLEKNVAVNTPVGKITVYNDSNEPRLMIEKDGQVTYLQGGKFLAAEFISANTFISCDKKVK